MLFCKKCGGLMIPKEGKMLCPKCGFKSKELEKTEIKEKIIEKEKPDLSVVEEEKSAYPLIDKECPKCGHKKAYFWEIQTRAGDEPATQFFKCEKCGHTWRHYD